MEELKVCPFCGNDVLELEYSHPQWVRLVCKNCKAIGPGGINKDTVIEKWNTQIEIERLEKEADWLAEFAVGGECPPEIGRGIDGGAVLRCNKDCINCWREAARMSVETNNE